MKYVLFCCFVVVAFYTSGARANPMQQCRVQNPAWYACQTGTECQMIGNPCGAYADAARADAAESAETCNRHVGAAISCEPSAFTQGKAFHAACVDGQCVAVQEKAAE